MKRIALALALILLPSVAEAGPIRRVRVAVRERRPVEAIGNAGRAAGSAAVDLVRRVRSCLGGDCR